MSVHQQNHDLLEFASEEKIIKRRKGSVRGKAASLTFYQVNDAMRIIRKNLCAIQTFHHLTIKRGYCVLHSIMFWPIPGGARNRRLLHTKKRHTERSGSSLT